MASKSKGKEKSNKTADTKDSLLNFNDLPFCVCNASTKEVKHVVTTAHIEVILSAHDFRTRSLVENVYIKLYEKNYVTGKFNGTKFDIDVDDLAEDMENLSIIEIGVINEDLPDGPAQKVKMFKVSFDLILGNTAYND